MRYSRIFPLLVFTSALSACSIDATGPDEGSVGFNWQVVSEQQGSQP